MESPSGSLLVFARLAARSVALHSCGVATFGLNERAFAIERLKSALELQEESRHWGTEQTREAL
jgi:hypothetical protein